MAAERRHNVYKVVVNHEEQYSIWPAQVPLPAGFKDTDGKTVSLDEAAVQLKRLQA